MRYLSLKLTSIIVIGLYLQVSIHAQDWNNQSAAELQQIREMRLLEWHAQQQSQASQQQSGQYQDSQKYDTQEYVNQGNNDLAQSQSQNVSFDQSYQKPPAQATPEREDLFNAANAGNIQQISKLLSQGLNINVFNSERETALHMAAARGHFDSVMLLVRNGANVNALTVKNWIPLHHAVRFRHPNVVNFLIQRGAWANARTSDGLSAIDMANNNRDYRLLSIMGAR